MLLFAFPRQALATGPKNPANFAECRIETQRKKFIRDWQDGFDCPGFEVFYAPLR
jgi:hypothetical protein